MTTYYKPEGTVGPYYNPKDSIVVVFPALVKIAVDSVTNPEHKQYQEFLYECGATEEGLKAAIQFYERYLDTLINRTAKEDPIDNWKECAMPADDISFLLFQSCIAGSLISTYHDALVDLGSTQPELMDPPIVDLKEFIESKR